MIFVIGLFPSIFLDRTKASIVMAHDHFKEASGQAIVFADDHSAKLLREDTFSPVFLKGAPAVEKKDQGDGEKEEHREGDGHDHGAQGALPAPRPVHAERALAAGGDR
jgi:NADH-quinone oxidoreductase subunit M